MALSDILEKIEKQAKDRVAELEKEFGVKKEALENEFRAKQKEFEAEMSDSVEKNGKKVLEKAEILAETERKNALLRAKREVLGEVIEDSVKELSRADNYEEIMVKMLKLCVLEGDNVAVFPVRGREEETKNAIKKAGKKYFMADKSLDVSGGFVIKTDKIEIDNSFETVVNDQLREDLEIKLNKLLF